MSPILAPTRPSAQGTCGVPTTCQPPSAWSKDPWPAVIRAIEPAGLSLTLGRRFERGSGLAIELPGSDGTSSTVLARVASVEPFGEGGWRLACTFISELSDEEVRKVLNLDPLYRASLEGDADDDARPPAVESVLFQARLGGGEFVRWFVKHLDLTADWPLAAGRAVTLGLPGPAGALAVELRVRDCRAFGTAWVVDVEFVARPGVEVLRVLAPGAVA